ncbi:hypothetical protein [Thalassobaculum litoreum]|uniref:Uncharacterized protein n=1 Tax=Thalassobaculum litoreum DSM 18839 TaxID=1123362 RepID=A0A8G2BKQ3_9PROT|nr:hypothetical protein [Thalassobaculum litoreum]SDF84294.1 hypothetical protein SAMN05660686_02504 [Thalassobaculum litoreum DSM 18839]
MTTYIVTLRFEHPAWDEINGIPYEIDAESKRDAIKSARRKAERDGHIGAGAMTGRTWFKAEAQV